MIRNLTYALLEALAQIEDHGQTVVARGQEQKEVLAALIQIARPNERVLMVPGRNNNIFAQIAETIWVLSGRDDLAFLSRYLPRAADFSDDGKTWRAAYGPRLRSWQGRIDQFTEVRKRLVEDPNTKRAVLAIFDPSADYADTKDVPCNNWLQFIHRDGVLHLNVTVRANDVIWGFTGINAFEWSVLHEMMAASFGWRLGTLSWFVGTLHVYERHYRTADQILRHQGIKSLYEFGIGTIPIEVGLDGLDEELSRVFIVEQFARQGDWEAAATANRDVYDPFLRSCAVMLRAFNAELEGLDHEKVLAIVSELPVSDLRVGALEYLGRRWKSDSLLGPLPPVISDFMRYYGAVRDTTASLVLS